MAALADATAPFAALELAHRLPRRLRFRFRLAPGVRLNQQAALQALEGLAGVQLAQLNMLTGSLTLKLAREVPDIEQLTAAILALRLPTAGLRAADKPGGQHQELASMAASAALLLAGNKLSPGMQMSATLAGALPLYKDALGDVFTEGINSHVLEALAVAISTASKDYTAANTTVFMLALGEYLENSIARRSNDLLKDLLRPNADWVWVEQDGVERQIEATAICVGATVIVGAGAAIPVDGTVLGGEALVNEAAMTGESIPVQRNRGDMVLSGTVVEEGRLRIYAEHVGSKTAAARIASYVEQSLHVKSQAQLSSSRLADKLVPGVLGLAGAAWLASGDWRRAAAVLQADYSCALKLATPVAFKSAMFKAGKCGILVKGADVLERLAEVDTFVFDKTGTLTTGQLAVTDSITFDPNYSAEDLINLAASVEEHYFHPLALAVVQAARQNKGRHFDHTEVHFIAAHGVASVIDGKRVVVGSRHFVEEDEAVPISQRQHQRTLRLYREGKTLLYIGFGGRLLGVIALKDQLRSNSAATVARLRRLGIKRIVMLTGDHQRRAAEIAAQLGIDEFHAQLLPHDKAALVAQMKAAGAKLAFVGDGINDAPALAGAHVGIAMSQGADIARLTSDIALLEDDIERAADAKQLANHTMRLIGRNFKLTVGLNSAILLAAASGKLTPIASSIAHNGSTITILLNALRGGQAALRASSPTTKLSVAPQRLRSDPH